MEFVLQLQHQIQLLLNLIQTLLTRHLLGANNVVELLGDDLLGGHVLDLSRGEGSDGGSGGGGAQWLNFDAGQFE